MTSGKVRSTFFAFFLLGLSGCATVPTVLFPSPTSMFAGLSGAELIHERPGQPMTNTENMSLAFIASRNSEAQIAALKQCVMAGNAEFQNQRRMLMVIAPYMILLEPWAMSIDNNALDFGEPGPWATFASRSVSGHFKSVKTAEDFASALTDTTVSLIGVIDITLVGGCNKGSPEAIRFKVAFVDRDLTVQCMVEKTITSGDAYKASGANPLTVTSTSYLQGYAEVFKASLAACIPGAGGVPAENARNTPSHPSG